MLIFEYLSEISLELALLERQPKGDLDAAVGDRYSQLLNSPDAVKKQVIIAKYYQKIKLPLINVNEGDFKAQCYREAT